MTTKIKASNIESGAVTADKLHTTAITDKLGFTPVTPTQLNNAVAAVDLTGLATETYVNNQINAVIDSAPGALDTLNELAAALGDDANFATTVTNALATKANATDVNNAIAAIQVTPTQVSDQANSSTGYFDLPSGTIAERPVSPNPGMVRNNTELRGFEFYNGSAWISLGVTDGSTAALAAPSATYLMETAGITTSGVYWLKPTTWNYPAQFYCELSKHGGGWIYVMQRQCVGDNGLPSSWLSGASGSQNHATSNFYGVLDSNGSPQSVMNIWDGFIGSGSLGKVYAREIQTSGGTYDESQRYVSNSDGPIYTRTAFTQLFYGNFSQAYNGSSNLSGITVFYNNGSSSVSNKFQTCWSGSGGLVTINNNQVDQELYFCNGEDGGDSNWMFALMKGGAPYPRIADSTNGGGRGSITRWGIIAIKA